MRRLEVMTMQRRNAGDMASCAEKTCMGGKKNVTAPTRKYAWNWEAFDLRLVVRVPARLFLLLHFHDLNCLLGSGHLAVRNSLPCCSSGGKSTTRLGLKSEKGQVREGIDVGSVSAAVRLTILSLVMVAYGAELCPLPPTLTNDVVRPCFLSSAVSASSPSFRGAGKIGYLYLHPQNRQACGCIRGPVHVLLRWCAWRV